MFLAFKTWSDIINQLWLYNRVKDLAVQPILYRLIYPE